MVVDYLEDGVIPDYGTITYQFDTKENCDECVEYVRGEVFATKSGYAEWVCTECGGIVYNYLIP